VYLVIREVQLTTNQTSNQILSDESKSSSHNHKRGKREEQEIKTTPNFSEYENWDGEMTKRCRPYRRPLLGLNLQIKNTVDGYKIVVDPSAQ
jgi:hypothetical protein